MPVKSEAIAFIVLIVSALVLRLIHLSADPPVELSTSQDIYTDPAQYTSYARNMVLYGTFNPLHDFRLVFFLKSATTLLSMVVFKVLGTGYLQANLVGLLFSFPTLIMLYFIVRKAAGNVAALFSLILISTDYNQIFYGRLSFLENSMNFFALLSFTILYFSKKNWPLILAGISLGVGIFFGKIIGMIYLLPFVCFAAYEYFYEGRDNIKKIITRYLYPAIGFLAVASFWYFFSYRPMARSVEGYIEEQAFSLYGAPDAFDSIGDFIYNYVSLGADVRLFGRMPIPAFLALGLILLFLYRIGKKENWKNRLIGFPSGAIFLITLMLGAYGALMIWNYRPLRYQTMMIYPIYGLAGMVLSRILTGASSKRETGGYLIFPAIFFILALTPIYQIARPIYDLSLLTLLIEGRLLIFLSAGLILTILFVVLKKHIIRLARNIPVYARQGVIMAIVVATIVPAGLAYIRWSAVATFTTIADSKDLAHVVSPEAIISGPYAADLTQENSLFNLIHMFGVANIDTAFFRKYPITHLLLDKSNEKVAREKYPSIMEKAPLVAHYYVGRRRANLYRVAGLTGNLNADQYQLSDFEKAMDFYTQQNADSGKYYMNLFLSRHPDNIAANFIAGTIASDLGINQDAEVLFKKAVEFSPTDFHLRYKLGEFYIRMFARTGNLDYKSRGEAEVEMARILNPTSETLASNVKALLNNEELKEIE